MNLKREFNSEAQDFLSDMFAGNNIPDNIELIENASPHKHRINVLAHDKKVVMTKELTYLEGKFLLTNSYWVKC